MMFSWGLIVFLSSGVHGQSLILPLVSESIEFDSPIECTCDFVYDEYDLTCGSNGVTYNNPTHLYCDQKCRDPNLRIAYKGPCKTEAAKAQNLTEDYALLNKLKMRVLNKCTCSQSNEFSPICGTNGHTYKNYAELQCDRNCRKIKVGIKSYGLCREDEYFKDPLPFLSDAVSRCNCGYTDERDPVCGTDGYTYPNPSMLNCVTSCNNPSLQIVHFGSCVKNQMPHNYGSVQCHCSSSSYLYSPLCASNGVTYDNVELFYCAQQCVNRHLSIVADQPCREKWAVDERGAL